MKEERWRINTMSNKSDQIARALMNEYTVKVTRTKKFIDLADQVNESILCLPIGIQDHDILVDLIEKQICQAEQPAAPISTGKG